MKVKILEQQKIVDEETKKLKDLIYQEELKNLIPFAKTYLGKCYKFRNSYGGGGKWWLYTKVKQVKGTTLYCVNFEKTSTDKIEIELSNKKLAWNGYDVFGGHIEISAEEFQQAHKLFMKQIKELTSLKNLRGNQ